MTDRPCFEVLLSDGSRFVADAKHLWVTKTKSERVRGRPGQSRTTEQLAATIRTGREWNHTIRCLLAGPAVEESRSAVSRSRGAVTTLERRPARATEHRAMVAVRPISSVPVRCIQVAAPSGMFLIGRTFVPTHNSSLGRLGLLTHSTAGFIDPGFSGHVTLELSNVANLPIKLYPGMKIGQICVLQLTSPAEHPYGSSIYGSRYQDQRGPTPSRSHLRFSRTPTQP
jgi:dUTPase